MAINKIKLACVLIAPKHAGKTVYVTALASLPFVGCGDPLAIKILKSHWQTLMNGEEPPATEATFNELSFTYRGEINGELVNADFSLPDYDGHFAEILSDYDSGEKGLQELREIFERAAGFIIFLPADERDVKNVAATRMELGHFIRLASLYAENVDKIKTPLIFAVNKWDKSPLFKHDDENARALEYIRSVPTYRELYDNINNFFENVYALPLSAYGHVSEDDKPKPGAMAPYRALEPIEIIFANFFANLDASLVDAEPAQAARALLKSRDLWKRGGRAQKYEQILGDSLGQAEKNLLSRLEQAADAGEYEEIIKKAPEADLRDYFPNQEALTASWRRAIDASARSLLQKLGATENYDDFKRVLNAEGRFADDFSEADKDALNALENKSRKKQIKRKSVVWLKRVIPLCIVAILLWGLWGYASFSSQYANAMSDARSAEEKWQVLDAFLDENAKRPFIALWGEGKLVDAAREREKLADEILASINSEVEKLKENPDFCARQRASEYLHSRSRQPGLNPSDGLKIKLEEARALATAQCELAKLTDSATKIDDLVAAENLLAGLASGEDKNALAEAVAAKKIALAHAADMERAGEERKANESRKVEARAAFAAIQDEANPLKKYEEAREFLNRFGKYPDCAEWIDETRARLPVLRSTALASLIANLEKPQGDDFKKIRTLAAEIGDSIPPEAKREFANALRPKIESFDRELIETVGERISGADQLEDEEKNLAEAVNYPGSVRLESGVFTYERPAELATELERKALALKTYRRILRDGAEAREFEVVAAPGNAAGVHGRKLSTGFTETYELDAALPGGIGSYSWRDKNFKKTARGDDYALNYGAVKIRAVNGKAVLRAPGLTGDHQCETPFKITAADLFRFENTGELEIPASGECRGVTFRFVK